MNVGDYVRVKSEKWIKENCENLESIFYWNEEKDISLDHKECFISDMFQHCDKIYTIKERLENVREGNESYTLNGMSTYIWKSWMLDSVKDDTFEELNKLLEDDR